MRSRIFLLLILASLAHLGAVETVTITATDNSASEDAGNTGLFTVKRATALATPLEVVLTITGTATNGADYATVASSVTIPANATSQTILVTPIDDTEAEGSTAEKVTITVAANAAYTIGSPSVATVSIIDNEPVVSIAATDNSANETPGNTGLFTITRTGSTAASLTVDVKIAGTATNGDDYQTIAATATIPAGSTTKTIAVTPIDDAVAESATAETVTLSILANPAYANGSPAAATVNITDNEPVVAISATDATANESGDTGLFTVTRTNATTASLTVNLTIAGTAINGIDYETVPETVTIPAGAASVTIAVIPINDVLAEGSTAETVTVTIDTDQTYWKGSPGSATVSIKDDEPVVTIAATDATANETVGDAGLFTVTRTNATAAALTVSLTISGTATNGDDYMTIPTLVTIPAGAASQTIAVTPIDDASAEGSTAEKVTIAIVANTAYAVGSPASATVSIVDNEPTVSITAADNAATETAGDTGTFTITRTTSTADALTVLLTIGGTAVNGGDYESIPATVTIPAGASSQNIIVTPIDDDVAEGTVTEKVTMVLAANASYAIGSPSSATVSITDNEPTVSILATNATSTETPGDTGLFTVTRTAATSEPLTVFLTITGTATNGVDYEAIPSTLIIPAGAASQTIVIAPIDDDVGEGNSAEKVTIAIAANAAYATGSPSSASVSITDNEPVVSIAATDAAATEAPGNTGSFTVTRTGSTASAVTVVLHFSGTATNGSDYGTIPETAIIPAGSATLTILVDPIDDSLNEATLTETVIAAITPHSGYAMGSPTSATVAITDNDPLNTLPTISNIPNLSVPEDTSTGELAFTVGDAETPVDLLTVSATSSNPILVPVSNILLSGSGANRTIRITPAANQNGGATITVSVSDGIGARADSISLSVTAVNDAPTISDITDQTIAEDTSTDVIPFTVGDPETQAASLTVTATSSDAVLFPDAKIILGGTGSNRTVTLTPKANKSGSATITVTITDGILTSSDSFVVTVTPTNDSPIITNVADSTIAEDSSTGPIFFNVVDLETNADDLVLSGTSSNTALIPNQNIVIAGTGFMRTVTITPALNQTGSSTITLSVSDGSISTSDTFVITVTEVNDAPTISAIHNTWVAAGSTTEPIAFTVGDPETDASALTVSATSSNQGLVPTDHIVLGGVGAERTITITPISGLTGDAFITVSVSDGELSVSKSFLLAVMSENTPPTISHIPDRAIGLNGQAGPISFQIADGQTAAGSLTVTVDSSNTALLPNSNIVLGGSDENRLITVNPEFGRYGTAAITITVSDGILTASDSFTLTVSSSASAIATIVVTPTPVRLTVGGSEQFSAVAKDQFDTAMTHQPSFAWTTNGGGAISSAGIFTATADGHYTVSAAASSAMGTADVTVVPSVGFAVAKSTVDESAGTKNIEVTLSSAQDVPVTVAYEVTSGSATPDADYRLVDGALEFASGETSKSIGVEIFADTEQEYDERVVISLSNPANIDLGVLSSHTLTIANDDLPEPVVSFTNSSPTQIEFFGSVPPGLNIDTVSVVVTSPDEGVTSSAEVSGDLFHVTLMAESSAVATAKIAFIDSHAHAGPASSHSASFISGTIGDRTTLAPGIPAVTLTVTDGLTGDMSGIYEGLTTSFTKNASVIVSVTASTALGTISELNLTTTDGQSYTIPFSSGTSVNGSVAIATSSDGLLELTASATAVNGDRSAFGQASSRLLVDKTPPELSIYSGPEYWTDNVPEALPMEADFNHFIYLNKNDEIGELGNKTLRALRSAHFYNKDSFSALAQVVETSGLKANATSAHFRPLFSGSSYALVVSSAASEDGTSFLVSGFGGIPSSEAVRGNLNIAMEDRCGNAVTIPACQLLIDTTEPDFFRLSDNNNKWYVRFSPLRMIPGNADGLGYTSPDVANMWRGDPGKDNRLLNGFYHWYFVRDLPLIHAKYLDQNRIDPESPGVDERFILQDEAGNCSSPKTFRFIWYQSSYESVSSRDPYATPVVSDESWSTIFTDQFCYDPFRGRANSQPRDFSWLSPEGLRLVVGGDDVSTPEIEWPAVIDAPKLDISDMVVRPLGPGPDSDERHVRPAIINVQPSWSIIPPNGNVPGYRVIRKVQMSVRDNVIRDFRKASYTQMYMQFGYVVMVVRNIFGDGQPGVADNEIVAEVDIGRPDFYSKSSIDQLGYNPFTYGITNIYGEPDNFSGPNSGMIYPDGYQNPTTRWVSKIGLSPDIVSTGQRVTLRVGGAFVDKNFDYGDFDKLAGDYVRFVDPNSNQDITVTRSRYEGSSPNSLRNKIAIVGQHFETATNGANNTLRQNLVIDVEVGDLVEPKLYHVDVKCGAVHEYKDSLSQLTAGNNGSHRMKEALAVAGVTCLAGHRFGSIHMKKAFRTDRRLPSGHDPYVMREPDGVYRIGDFWFITDKIGPNDPNFAIFETGPIGGGMNYELSGCTRIGPQMYSQYQWLVDSVNYFDNLLFALGLRSESANYTILDFFNMVMSSQGYRLDVKKVAEGRYWQSPGYTRAGKNEITGRIVVQGRSYPLSLKLAVDCLTMRVDANSDRRVSEEDDLVKAFKPFHFWTNVNNGYSEGVRDDDSMDVSSPYDSKDARINGIRDLIDMAPMSIDLSENLRKQLNEDRSRWRLKVIREGTGTINLFSLKRGVIDGGRGEPASDLSYLTYRDFGLQTLEWSQKYDVDTALKSGYAMPPAFMYMSRNWFLFEGSSNGEMVLKVVLVDADDGDREYECDSVRIKLEEISQFYVMLNAETDLIANNPAFTAQGAMDERYSSVDPMPGKSLSSIPSSAKILIFAHGFNVDSDAAKRWFDETYKRLYWTGFKNEFIGLHWNGADPAFIGGPPAKFNTNISHAFQTGSLLATWLPTLTSSHEVSLLSHSAGGVVVLETLRLMQLADPSAKKVKNLITMEAATFANVFASSLPAIDSNPGTFDNLSHNNWFRPALSMVSGTYENFYSDNDHTLWLTMCDGNENLGVGKLLGHASDSFARIDLQAIQRNDWRMSFRIPGTHSFGPDEFGVKCVIPHHTPALGSVAVAGIANVNCELPGFGINHGKARNYSAGSHSFLRETNYDETYLLLRRICEVTK